MTIATNCHQLSKIVFTNLMRLLFIRANNKNHPLGFVQNRFPIAIDFEFKCISYKTIVRQFR